MGHDWSRSNEVDASTEDASRFSPFCQLNSSIDLFLQISTPAVSFETLMRSCFCQVFSADRDAQSEHVSKYSFCLFIPLHCAQRSKKERLRNAPATGRNRPSRQVSGWVRAMRKPHTLTQTNVRVDLIHTDSAWCTKAYSKSLLRRE